MKRILILLAFSFLVTGFAGCPLGNDEPNVSPCGLFPPKIKEGPYYFTCYPYQKPSFEMSMEEAIKEGFMGLITPEYSEVVKHHDKNHVDLDLCD